MEKQNILIVGGGDSAVETALLLADKNNVTLSYRSENFSRVKPKNLENINHAMKNETINVILNSNVYEINDETVELSLGDKIITINNDLVYIFAGGELPTEFLTKAGITITKKYGEAILKN